MNLHIQKVFLILSICKGVFWLAQRQILFSQMLICQAICLQEILKTNNAKYVSLLSIIDKN